MIIYKLICKNDHRFEGWFASSEDYENQHAQDKLSCPVCGDDSVNRIQADSAADAGVPIESAIENDTQNSRLSSQQVFQHLIGYVTQDADDFGNAIIKKIRDFHSQQTKARSKVGNAPLNSSHDAMEETIEVFMKPGKMREKLH